MATFVWVGGVNSDSTNAANWDPASGVPGAGDVAQLDGGVNCDWAISPIGTITERGAGSYTGRLTLPSGATAINAFYHNFILSAASGAILLFSGSTTLSSGRYVDIGSNASYSDSANRANLTFAYAAGSNEKFDKGAFPNILLSIGSFSPQYSTPTVSTNTDVNFLSLTVSNNVTFAPTAAAPTANDRDMSFIINRTTFALSDDVFNAGQARWTLQ